MSKQSYSKILDKNRLSYRDYYTLKNLVAVRTGSIIFLILNLILRIMYEVFPESLTRAQNYPEFNYANWLYIAITPIFLLGSYLLIYIYGKQKRATIVTGFFIFLFASHLTFSISQSLLWGSFENAFFFFQIFIISFHVFNLFLKIQHFCVSFIFSC